MTRDRAAVKKIVQHAIKNNPQVIVALILVLGELVRRPGAPALTSAEAEDAVDEVEAGNDTAPLETAPEGSRLGVFEPASDSVHAAGKVLFAQDAAAEQRIGQRQKLSFRIRRAAGYGPPCGPAAATRRRPCNRASRFPRAAPRSSSRFPQGASGGP